MEEWRVVVAVGQRGGGALLLSRLSSFTHQRFQHARLARALGADDRDLGQVDPEVEVDLVVCCDEGEE